jgi:hypothetical protein
MYGAPTAAMGHGWTVSLAVLLLATVPSDHTNMREDSHCTVADRATHGCRGGQQLPGPIVRRRCHIQWL